MIKNNKCLQAIADGTVGVFKIWTVDFLYATYLDLVKQSELTRYFGFAFRIYFFCMGNFDIMGKNTIGIRGLWWQNKRWEDLLNPQV